MRAVFVAILLIGLISIGCFRGVPSSKPPIHLNPNMDKQPKYKGQEESNFFEDGSTMRLPIEGTVARGELREDVVYYTGKDAQGNYVQRSPVPSTMATLRRGQERFDIYCSPCHGRTGYGQGMVVKRGMIPPPSFHDERTRKFPDGQIFDVVSNGVRNMPSYRHQIPVEDRWAIVAFVRALQRSQNATKSDIPQEVLDSLGKQGS